MTYPTTITAEPGLPFVDIMRDFAAPAAAVEFMQNKHVGLPASVRSGR